MQESVMQLLSPILKNLITVQWQYYDECSGLQKVLEGSPDDVVAEAVSQTDETWKKLIACQERAANGSDMFIMLSGKHMPPAHRLWLWMGGMQMSTLVRSFITIANVADSTRITLTRLVERWTIQEQVLERGKQQWNDVFVDCCVSVIQLQPEYLGSGHVPIKSAVSTPNQHSSALTNLSVQPLEKVYMLSIHI